MTEKRFMEILTAVRIGMLLERAGIGEKDTALDEYEAILEDLDENKRRQLRTYMDQMAGQEAARGGVLYQGGLYDGIRLMGKIIKIAEAEP